MTRELANRGRNRIYLHYLSQPLNFPQAPTITRQACFEVFFPGDGRRDPPEIDLQGEEWAELRESLEAPLESIRACIAPEEGALFDRPLIEEELGGCFPDEIPVGGFLYDRETLIELLRFGFTRDLQLKLPANVVDLFQPLARFDEESHCYQPFKIEQLRRLREVLASECTGCSSRGGEE